MAANLKRDLLQPQTGRAATKSTSSGKKGRGQGSDFGSGRGSEERHSSAPAGARGTKRGKDNDIEKVSHQAASPLKHAYAHIVIDSAHPPTSNLPVDSPSDKEKIVLPTVHPLKGLENSSLVYYNAVTQSLAGSPSAELQDDEDPFDSYKDQSFDDTGGAPEQNKEYQNYHNSKPLESSRSPPQHSRPLELQHGPNLPKKFVQRYLYRKS